MHTVHLDIFAYAICMHERYDSCPFLSVLTGLLRMQYVCMSKMTGGYRLLFISLADDAICMHGRMTEESSATWA